MGLFDFFKKKGHQEVKTAPESPKQTSKQESARVGSHQQNTAQQEHKQQPHQPQLSKEERYGKYSLQGYKSSDWTEPLAEFQKLEDEGFYEASIALGQFAQITDNDKAFAHFKKAADAGLAEAQWSCAAILGHEYIPEIDGKDKEWYKYCLAAAKGGCCDAMNELGNIYQRQNNFLAAYYWYQMATWYEHPQGMMGTQAVLQKWQLINFADMASTIDGVRQIDVDSAKRTIDFFAGKETLTPEVLNGLMPNCLADYSEFMPMFLGHLFEDVIHVDTQSKLFYQMAGHNHSIMGMKSIGDMLAAGKGCQRDMDKAFSWYEGAGEANEKTACFIMGEKYRLNNKNLAAYWYTKAFRRGYEPARQRMLTGL